MNGRPGSAHQRPWPWALLAGLIAAEACLFAVAVRPVARAWPTRFDQATFLARTYELHERAGEIGFLRAAGEFVRTGLANGVLLPVEAAVLFRLTGPSRAAALVVNFVHYVALAVALFLAARRLSGRTGTGLLAVGFLLLSRTPFFWVGGLLDFRFDFAAACLYGIALSLALMSDGFARGRLAALAGAAAAACIATRFVTLAYVAGLFTLAAAAFTWRGRIEGPNRERLRGLAAAAFVGAAVAGPFVWWSRDALRDYYVSQHFGDLGRVRAAALFDRGLPAFLAYYPYQALLRHAGLPLLALTAVLAVLVWRTRNDADAIPSPGLRPAALWVTAAFVVPAAALTLGPQRQPDVASILLVPVLLACVLAVIGWGGSARGRALERVGAAAALAIGLALQAVRVLGPVPGGGAGRDANEVARLHDAVFTVARRLGLSSPLLSVDRITDAFDATIFEAYAYERHGVLVRARHGLGASLLASSDAEALGTLRASDFVLLTRTPAPKLLVFPFTQQMERLAPEVRAFCETRLISEGSFRYGGGEVELFRRR